MQRVLFWSVSSCWQDALTDVDMKGGELFNHIVAKRRLSELEASKYFQQIVFALEYCHNNLVIHRGAIIDM